MTSTDKLTRVGEPETVFKITFHSHWSDIMNESDPSDTDTIKWLGSDEYVSAMRGYRYRVLPSQ